MADEVILINPITSQEVQSFTNEPRSIVNYFHASLMRGDKKWRKVATADNFSGGNTFPAGSSLTPMAKFFSSIQLKEVAILDSEPFYDAGGYEERIVYLHYKFEYQGAELEMNEIAILKLIHGSWKIDIMSGPAIEAVYSEYMHLQNVSNEE